MNDSLMNLYSMASDLVGGASIEEIEYNVWSAVDNAMREAEDAVRYLYEIIEIMPIKGIDPDIAAVVADTIGEFRKASRKAMGL